jgi:hypothetical protein
MYTIISSSNSDDTLASSFLICVPFTSICCLIALARTLSTVLNKQGESGQPGLISNFSGIASSFSQFNLMLAVGWVYIAFIMFRYAP